MQQLTGMDSIFLATERLGIPQHISSVFIYDQSTAPGGKVRFKDILKVFEQRAHLSPIFRRKLVEVPFGLDQPYWVADKQFDPEFHVRHVALPKPGDWRQLCILCARMHARPLDLSRPLWEAYMIEGLNNIAGVPAGGFALLTKIHHSAMDGITGMQFYAALHDSTPEPRVIAAPAARSLERYPSTAELLGRAYVNNLRRPKQLFKLIGDGIGSYRRVRSGRKQQAFHDIGPIPKTRFQTELSPSRVVDAVKFNFAHCRKIKNNVAGATINDVALAVVAGALRNYLLQLDELPEESLFTGCPVDIREDGEKDAGGNLVGLMVVPVRTDIEDPLQRLHAIHQESLSAKARFAAMGARISMDVLETVPSGIMSLVVRATTAAGLGEAAMAGNTVVTNVPGVGHQLYFVGAAIVDQIHMGPLTPGTGLFHTVTSQVNNKQGVLSLSFVACRDMLPVPAFYAQCLRDSFDELYKASSGVQRKAS